MTHQYKSAGIYAVSLTVVDDKNISEQCETTAELWGPCGDCPPTCDAGGPYEGVVGAPVLFDGSGSYSPTPCAPIVDFVWDFGDGAIGVGPSVDHTYSAPGFYTVTLVVVDLEGYKSYCTTTAEITIPSAIEPVTWGRVKHGAAR